LCLLNRQAIAEKETLRAAREQELAAQRQEMETVGVIPINGFALVATSGDMVSAAGPFDTQRACHIA